MPEDSSRQDAQRWKQKYYEHLDVHDQKTKDWQAIESVLKKTVLRLSITGEGQHKTIDRYLHDIRAAVKQQVNIIRLENTLTELSSLMLKLGERQVVADNKVITMLLQLLEKIDFPAASSKQKNKLIKKLSKATDEDSETLTSEVQHLLSAAIKRLVGDAAAEPANSGFFKNLFKAPAEATDKGEITNDAVIDKTVIDRVEIDRAKGDEAVIASEVGGNSRVLVRARAELPDELGKPSAQQVLVDLLTQLVVPSDRCEELDKIKSRIETEHSASSWPPLLKDIADMVNTLQSGMAEEKQAFERFLQQITGRLKEMDSFLSQENASLNEAEQAGSSFDAVLSAQVQDIQLDMNSSCNLNELKGKVETRLAAVSDHIKQYRVNERERFSHTQSNVANMQSRLQQLEQETDDLRELVLVKDKEAMFDVLTKIPNRLSYEKKAIEEIGRCKRFSTPLSMAVWDIDLFKRVNDTYGHKVGDKILHAVAQLLNDRMRETDFIARYGGEEFVMFLPGANEAEALELADVLREKVSACKFKYNAEVFSVTVSCGVTDFVAGDSHEAMFERADKALYAAKHSGRNKCLAASSS